MTKVTLKVQHRLKMVFLLINILIILMFVISLGVSYYQFVLGAEKRAVGTTQILERSLSDVLDQIDLMLISLQDELETELKKGAIEPQEINRRVLRYVDNVPGLTVVRYTDARGIVDRNAGYPHESPVINVSDREYFRSLSAGFSEEMIHSSPLYGRTSNEWVIVFARAYYHPDKKFAGVVYASISLKRIGKLFEGLNVGPRSQIIFFDGENTILSIFPFPEDPSLLGKNIKQKQVIQKQSPETMSLPAFTVTDVDGIERIHALRKLERRNYWIMMGLCKKDELQPWRRQTAFMFIIFLTFVALTAVSGSQLRRALKNQGETLLVLEHTLEATDNGILVVGEDGKTLHCNQLFSKLWHIPDDIIATAEDKAMINYVYDQLVDPEKFVKKIEQLYANPQQESLDIVSFKDGRVFERASFPMMVNSAPRGRVWSFRDITNRVAAETALRESEFKYRTLLENLNAGVVVHGPDGAIKISNTRAGELMGFIKTDVEGKSAKDKSWKFIDEHYNPVPLERFPVMRILKNKQPIVNLVGGVHNPVTGETTWLLINGYPLLDANGDIEEVVISFFDVTDRKRIEDELRMSEEKYRRIVENSHELIAEMSSDGKFLYLSPNHITYTGYTPEELEGNNGFIMVHPDDLDDIVASFYTQTEGLPTVIEYRIVRKTGEVRWMDSTSYAYKTADGQVRYSVFSRDVTDRHEAQILIRESEEKFSKAFRVSPYSMAISTLQDGIYREVNRAFVELTGFSREEIIGKNSVQLALWVNAEERQVVREQLESGVDVNVIPVTMRMKSGEVKYVLYSAVNIQIAGEPSILSMAFDVTEQRHIERELRESESRLVEAQSIAHLGNWDLDLVNNVLIASEEYYRIFELDPKTIKDAHKTLRELIHPDDLVKSEQALYDARDKGLDFSVTFRLLFPDGRIKYVYQRSMLDCDKDGAPVRTHGIIQDITERELAKEQIVKSLQEKDTLIRELYHRTKNTLQIIRSMIHLQSVEYADNREFQELASTINHRIEAIALVQQMLYKSNNLSQILIVDYVNRLCLLLSQSFGITDDRITFNVLMKDQSFMIDTAVPFGLILNELITNSLKYAFPDNREGVISITLSKGENRQNRLTYRDNGVGVPPDFDFRNRSSLGLKLVYQIGEMQMRGTVEIFCDKGLCCVLEFDGDLYSSRV